IREMFLPQLTRTVTGEEGSYTHEIIVPVWSVNTSTLAEHIPPVRKPSSATPHKRLRFRDGVLFAKIYGGESALDKLLRDGLREFVDRAGPQLELRNWFFIRYADPLAHLRLRL